MKDGPAPVKERTRIPPEELRWSCPDDCMKFDTTAGVDPVESTIGQDRALHALKIGLELMSPGYNVYVSGLVGTGRTTTVKELLAEISPDRPVPRDRAFVMNFEDRDRPRLLTFSPGEACEFRRDMEQFTKEVRRLVPNAFESKEVTDRREEIVKRFGEKSQEELQEFQDELAKEGLALVTVQMGPVPHPDIFPLHEGEPISPADFEKLVESGEVTEERVEEVKGKIEEYHSVLREHLRKGREQARKMTREIEEYNRALGSSII